MGDDFENYLKMNGLKTAPCHQLPIKINRKSRRQIPNRLKKNKQRK